MPGLRKKIPVIIALLNHHLILHNKIPNKFLRRPADRLVAARRYRDLCPHNGYAVVEFAKPLGGFGALLPVRVPDKYLAVADGVIVVALPEKVLLVGQQLSGSLHDRGSDLQAGALHGVRRSLRADYVIVGQAADVLRHRVGLRAVSAAPSAAGRKQENCRNENRKEEGRSFCGVLFYFCFQLCTSFSHGFLKRFVEIVLT